MTRFAFGCCVLFALANVPLIYAQSNSAGGNSEPQNSKPASPPLRSEPAPQTVPSPAEQAPKEQTPQEQPGGNQTTPVVPAAPAPEQAKTAAKLKTEVRKNKEEEHKPADPDTGTSPLSDETLGLLKNPWVDRGIKFSASYVGEILGNPSGGFARARSTKGGSTSRSISISPKSPR